MKFLALAIIAALLGANSVQAPPERRFEDAACRVAFHHPDDWTVSIDSSAPFAACRFVLSPLAWDSLIVDADSVEFAYTVNVTVEERSFEDAVEATAFQLREGKWIALGRQGHENNATAIARNGWRGVWGEPLMGCYRIAGAYVSACELPSAVVGTQARIARLWGGQHSFDVFLRVLETLELRAD